MYVVVVFSRVVWVVSCELGVGVVYRRPFFFFFPRLSRPRWALGFLRPIPTTTLEPAPTRIPKLSSTCWPIKDLDSPFLFAC